MFQSFLKLLFPYPSMCLFCHAPLDGLGICKSCETRLEKRSLQLGHCKRCHHYGRGVMSCQNCMSWGDFPFKVLARYPYEKEVKEALIKFKFHEEAWRGEALGKTLLPLVERHYDFILPVPLHKKRLSERGYNQSYLLSKAVSEATGIPLDNKCLIRQKATTPQSTLSRKERVLNVKKAFRLNFPEKLKGKDLLLVDDIITTGATLFACAKLLIEEGEARSVTALCVASGIS